MTKDRWSYLKRDLVSLKGTENFVTGPFDTNRRMRRVSPLSRPDAGQYERNWVMRQNERRAAR
jgi:hypothetical protein